MKPGVSPRIAALLLVCPVALSVHAGTEDYQADLDQAHWAVAASPLSCRLSHRIPMYGEAVFTRTGSGDQLDFHLIASNPSPRGGSATLAAVPPAWMHGVAPRDLGGVDVAAGPTPVHLDRGRSLRVLEELQEGLFPTVTYQARDDGTAQIRVTLSAVNFRKAYAKFLDCGADLLPFGFDAVSHTQVHFDVGTAELPLSAAQPLQRLARYVRADHTVQQVVVSGYADGGGYRRFNRKLSKLRAEAVRRYLLAQGVPRDKIHVKAFGEAQPVATNATDAGRAKNRRALVVLLK